MYVLSAAVLQSYLLLQWTEQQTMRGKGGPWRSSFDIGYMVEI